MGLVPGIGPRERILTFGVGGTGKSEGLLTIAREAEEGSFYIIDNDLSAERLLATKFPEAADRVTIFDHMPSDWEALLDRLRKLVEVGEREDWLSIDSVTPTWDAVQGWWVETQFGEGVAEHLTKLRGQAKDTSEFNKLLVSDMMWQIVNKEYGKLYDLLLRWPGHLYLTAELTTIGGDNEDRDIKNMFGAYGVKPRGNKRLGHISSTTLMMTKSRVGEFYMTTIKDRGRREVENQQVTDFALDYLVAVAKWKFQ